MPFSMAIEPTTSCNLRCPECPSGLRSFTRPQGIMSMKLFSTIINQLKGHLLYLTLYFQGEPLLNPDFFEMIALASRKKIYTATSTNAHQIDDENARKLVESGLDRLIISMDGADQVTYERYRKGGDIEKVKEGIRNVVAWKKRLDSRKPMVIIQFLVFKFNEQQIPEVRQIANELGADRLDLKSAQVYGFENDTEFIPDNKKYSRYTHEADGSWKLKKAVKNRCFRMWSSSVISWDGRVVPCCFDKDAKHQLGQLEEDSYRNIWKSKKYNVFRKQILKARCEIDICRNCTE